jgi:hypothetical protein
MRPSSVAAKLKKSPRSAKTPIDPKVRTSYAAGKKNSAVNTNGKVPKKDSLKRTPPKRANKASTPKMVPKGTAKGGKGKVIYIDVNDSDEDSLGFDDKGIM